MGCHKSRPSPVLFLETILCEVLVMNHKIHVVVLGAGYSGLMAAMRLVKKTKNDVTITLIDADEIFHERTRNHQMAAKQPLPQRPITSFLHGTRIQFMHGRVAALMPSERLVMVDTRSGVQTVGYDYLVYALGSFVNTDAVPGVREHAFTIDYSPAMALALHLPDLATQGGRLLIVGGGNTGVEVSTEIAETYPGLEITLVTRSSFARNLSPAARTHIRSTFERFGIKFVERTAITKLQEHHAFTERVDNFTFDACIWVCGFAVSDLPKRAGLLVNERGQILIDRAMRSISHPEIYAVGDAASPVEDPGAPIRMGLYTAIMMGGHGADCLAAELNGKQPTAFGLSYIALGVSLGRNDGVWQFLNWDHDTPLNLIFTGKLANLLREFFVNFAIWAIRVQSIAPWVFEWPGKRKLRSVAVPRPHLRNSLSQRIERSVSSVH
jgi:NADH:ubiquinone reductase (H+-translocating)